VTAGASAERDNHRLAGFTLVEALLVVTLLGILATLAAPSYQGFLQRAHRSGAIAQLMVSTACQERQRARTGAYDTTLCLAPATEHYQFNYQPEGQAGVNYFELKAQPLDGQASDACGVLSLDSLGVRSAGDAESDIPRCWSAR